MKLTTKFKNSLITVVGLIFSILIISAFVFMAAKFNPDKTKEYANNFFRTTFPAYNVSIEDVSVRIGLVTSIVFKNVNMRQTSESKDFVNLQKLQIKISLSTILFRKKPLDINLEAIKINSEYLRLFVHRYLIEEPFSTSAFNIPEFVKASGINFKLKDINVKTPTDTIAFDRMTIRARANSLWAYEIEGNHTFSSEDKEWRVKHISVGEIHFFEKTSQITFLSQTNDFVNDVERINYKDVKIQGSLDVPSSGEMRASLNLSLTDGQTLNLSWDEDEKIELNEVTGTLPVEVIKAIGITQLQNAFSLGTLSFKVGNGMKQFQKANQLAYKDLVFQNYNKTFSDGEYQLQSEGSVPLGNLSLNYLVGKKNQTGLVNFKSKSLPIVWNNTVIDWIKNEFKEIPVEKVDNFNFEIEDCLKNDGTCRFELARKDDQQLNGHIYDSLSVKIGDVQIKFENKRNWILTLSGIDVSRLNLELPFDGRCELKIERKNAEDHHWMNCTKGSLEQNFLMSSGVSNSMSYRKLLIDLKDDDYLIQVTPLKGRPLQLKGPLVKTEKGYSLYLDTLKTIGFTFDLTSGGVRFA